MERVIVERDRMLQENSDVGKDKEDLELDRKKLKAELREIKFRETSLITENNELEEENVILQKQVSVLKSSQVEFEANNYELRRIQEEVTLLNCQVEELAKLKKIAENQMEEALQSLQSEREAKYALKKELDQHINRESLYNISNLAYSIRGMEEGGLASDGEDDLPTLKRIEADLKRDSDQNLMASPDKQVDLFSEIHLNELKKLEKQLEIAETEKNLLTQNLRDSQNQVEKNQNELQSFMGRLVQLSAHVESLQHLKTKIDKEIGPNKENNQAIINLSKMVDQYHRWFGLSSKEIEQLRNDLKDLEQGLNCSDATLQLRTEITNIKNKLLDTEQKSAELALDVRILGEIAGEAGSALDVAQNDLSTVSDELAQLYHHVCTVNGETPSRVLLDHEKHGITPSK